MIRVDYIKKSTHLATQTFMQWKQTILVSNHQEQLISLDPQTFYWSLKKQHLFQAQHGCSTDVWCTMVYYGIRYTFTYTDEPAYSLWCCEKTSDTLVDLFPCCVRNGLGPEQQNWHLNTMWDSLKQKERTYCTWHCRTALALRKRDRGESQSDHLLKSSNHLQMFLQSTITPPNMLMVRPNKPFV